MPPANHPVPAPGWTAVCYTGGPPPEKDVLFGELKTYHKSMPKRRLMGLSLAYKKGVKKELVAAASDGIDEAPPEGDLIKMEDWLKDARELMAKHNLEQHHQISE